MTSMYHKVLALIKLPPEQRSTRECQELVDWLRAKSKILANVKYDIVPPSDTVGDDVITEVIRYCAFETRNPDDVIIKQGERGHRLYIALQGHVSIYVINKETASDGSRDNNVINEEVLQTVTTACEQKKLDRNVLGTMVWSGDGGTFGEVALIETDCVRTASVVADTHMDLLIVERDLFNRCLRGIVAEDMLAKTQFVERNPIFRSWPPRQRKQLVISLTTERVSYGARIIRQGQEASQIYFISSGEVEIHVDPRQYKTQFPRMWEEMLTLVPDLNSRDKSVALAPHEARIQRLAVHKPQQICLLGENEHLGSLEMIVGLDNYMETATARSTCTLLKLRRQQYDRMFKRKYAVPTVASLKDNLATRLCLYIYQCLPQDSAFLKYLNMRLADASLLATLRKSKQVFDTDGVFQNSIIDKARSEAMTELMKRLHMPSDTAASLPLEDMSEVALANMDRRLKSWSQKSRLNGSKLASIHTPHLPQPEGTSPRASPVPTRT